MSEAEALVQVAEAINKLASGVNFIGSLLFFAFLLKNMGTSSVSLDGIAQAIRNLKDE